MSFLKSLFADKEEAESVVLVDIGATKVVGAYAHYAREAVPVLIYEKSVAVETHAGEEPSASVIRAVKALGDSLIREGAPALLRATGSGSAHAVLVSIDPPWQKTSVRTEYIEDAQPFLFTKDLVETVLSKTREQVPGKVLADESVIGTILNGYVTKDPFDKSARRAELVILTSLIDEGLASELMNALQNLFHTRAIYPIAGSSLRYQAVRAAFPHEQDALIIDVTGTVTSIALVRRDLFMTIVEIDEDVATADAWIKQVTEELGLISRRYPLPRTIFLLAREPAIVPLQQALGGTDLGSLWLSDNPPAVVPVLSGHLTALVHKAIAESPDLILLLMALYWRHRVLTE